MSEGLRAGQVAERRRGVCGGAQVGRGRRKERPESGERKGGRERSSSISAGCNAGRSGAARRAFRGASSEVSGVSAVPGSRVSPQRV